MQEKIEQQIFPYLHFIIIIVAPENNSHHIDYITCVKIIYDNSDRFPGFLQIILRVVRQFESELGDKTAVSVSEGTSVIFECKLKNILKIFLLESILTRKKILWRINFILIKFLLNKILLEKIWNECKKTAFLHKAIVVFDYTMV